MPGRSASGSSRTARTVWPTRCTGWVCEPGDRVAYVAQNHLEYVVLEFALLKAGLVKVPLNFRLTPGELRWCMELADVRLAVADAGAAAALDEVWSEGELLKVVLGERPGWLAFADLVAGGSATRVQAPTGPSDAYHVRFSSGSTGRPKGITISHAGARSAILGNTWVMSTSGPVARPRTLQVAPLVYAGGWSVLPTLLCGGTNVVLERFDADQTLRAIAGLGIDWMFAVPTMLRRMSTSSDLPLLREARLSCLMLAGEPAALPALEAVSEHTDALVQCWGQTEAPASTTMLSRQEMRHSELWGSIGRPVPGVEFSVLVEGEVLAGLPLGRRGAGHPYAEYHLGRFSAPRPERETRLLPGGWWRTSDLGHSDDEGRIFIVGRASETIITGGTNIPRSRSSEPSRSSPMSTRPWSSASRTTSGARRRPLWCTCRCWEPERWTSTLIEGGCAAAGRLQAAAARVRLRRAHPSRVGGVESGARTASSDPARLGRPGRPPRVPGSTSTPERDTRDDVDVVDGSGRPPSFGSTVRTGELGDSGGCDRDG